MQIDSFMELPKNKRPPESIWDDSDELNRWFDNVFGTHGSKSSSMEIVLSDIEG